MLEPLHSKILNRWVLKCTINPKEHMHLGIGRDTTSLTASDLPIATIPKKDGTKYPFIPGSSLKGLFRAHLTRLYNSLENPTALLKNKYPNLVGEVQFNKANTPDELEDLETGLQKSKDNSEKMEFFKKLDPISKMFGVSGWASPIRFTDAVPENTDAPETAIVTRTHIKVDLGTDKVESGALFTLESTLPSLTFEFLIIYDELDGLKDTNIIFNIFFDLLKKGILTHVGGMKSRGYGFAEIKLKEYKIYTPQDLFLGNEPEWISLQKDGNGEKGE